MELTQVPDSTKDDQQEDALGLNGRGAFLLGCGLLAAAVFILGVALFRNDGGSLTMMAAFAVSLASLGISNLLVARKRFRGRR